MTKRSASLDGPTPRTFCVPIMVGPTISLDRGFQPERTDVERVSLVFRDPFAVQHHELLDELGQLLAIEVL